jgi:hypothetical protein
MEKTETRSAKKLSKKQAKKIAFKKLSDALAEYKESLKKKKFRNHLKKASKLFASDIAKASREKKVEVKKIQKVPLKKVPVKQEAQVDII